MVLYQIRSIFERLFSRMIRHIVLIRYDNYNIAEYFRKQGAKIGENCCIFVRSLGSEPYMLRIGNHVCINSNVQFHTHDGGTWVFREMMPDLRVFGPIIIEDNCLIGESVKILPNVRIGKNSIVGAGSVVISDVPPNSIVMGVPARRFGSIDKYMEKCIARWKIQKPANFRYDSLMNWETSPDAKAICEQVKEHLLNVFKEELK